MKTTAKFFILLAILSIQFSYACEACKLQQPKLTRNITHGAGPESRWDWLIVGIVSLIVLYTLFYSVKYLVQPGEKNADHIKNSILDQR